MQSLTEIYHRGPDDSGVFNDVENSLFLGHTRLSIIELSQRALQPIHSMCKRYTLVFNGEIYNFKELAQENSLSEFSYSDTKVLVELISKRGVRDSLDLIRGMFAFAVYDHHLSKVFLVRDRFGEKPLYYFKQGESWGFSSELKPITCLKYFKKRISRQALRDYFAYNYIPAPLCIFEDVHKLQAGRILEYDLYTKKINIEVYWEKPTFKSNNKTLSDNTQYLEDLLLETVEKEMISDVDLAAFLSGGVDSTLIVSLMSKISNGKVNTFTVGFDNKFYNEAELAKETASYLGTNHTEIYATEKDVLDIVPNLAKIYDEPMSDSSQLPTHLVSTLIKKNFSVAISGDGGDELFGGYNRYLWGPKIYDSMRYLPLFSRQALRKMIHILPPDFYTKFLRVSGDKVHKLANIFDFKNQFDLYDSLITHWKNESPLNYDMDYSKYHFSKDIKSFEENMMSLDVSTYMSDDILVKVDRASMAVSLETRAPFLDHKIFEFSSTVPLNQKIAGGKTKIILKEVLKKYIPEKLINRPKMGFAIPMEYWLRKELKEWANEILSEKNLKKSNLLNVELIRNKWEEHLSGKRNWQYFLWDIIVFQMWFDEYMGDN